MKFWLLALGLVNLPNPSFATTAADLSQRIHIDGDLRDYAADEWILDAGSARPERPRDSQWGPDNEIRRVALTWDRTFLYIAIDCVTSDAGVMTWLELAAGGVHDLSATGVFRRAIVLGGIAPNILAWADPGGVVDVARASSASAFAQVDDERLARAFVRVPGGTTALEMAIPWSEVPPVGPTLGFLAAITGGIGTGSGDAAPDPSGPLSSRRSARATLDQILRVTFDADGDRVPDEGVSPRVATEVSPGNAAGPSVDARVVIKLSDKAFAPEQSEELAFDFCGAGEEAGLFLTCRVYSISGQLVRTLYESDFRLIRQGSNAADPRDRWDGRDESGNVVPGGVYVVNLLWGQTRGTADASARESVVIVR